MFSVLVTHSKFESDALSLFPSLWLHSSPRGFDVENVSITSLCKANVFLLFPALKSTAGYRLFFDNEGCKIFFDSITRTFPSEETSYFGNAGTVIHCSSIITRPSFPFMIGVGLLKIILTVTCKVPLMIRYCPVYSQITVPHSWR